MALYCIGRDQDITLAYGIDGEINEPVFEMMERFAKAYQPGRDELRPVAGDDHIA